MESGLICYTQITEITKKKQKKKKKTACAALNLLVPVTKIAEFANSHDLDEVAHNEPPQLDLHCSPSSL